MLALNIQLVKEYSLNQFKMPISWLMQEEKIELGVEEVHEPLEIPIDVNRAGSNPLSGKI